MPRFRYHVATHYGPLKRVIWASVTGYADAGLRIGNFILTTRATSVVVINTTPLFLARS